ncbi:MAG: hypothetical protein SX243_25170 [Acidobacteriota bacterium]|nr:hypothetical protein [Acidobacteriota bacterium]
MSNGGACGNLVVFGLLGSYSQWGKLAQVFVWGSAAVTGLVALSLYAYGVREGARETES